MSADLVREVGPRLELECRMGDVEMAGEAILQRIKKLRRMAGGKAMVFKDDVRRQSRQPGRDRPNVQIVDVDHMRDINQMRAHFGEIDALRGGL